MHKVRGSAIFLYVLNGEGDKGGEAGTGSPSGAGHEGGKINIDRRLWMDGFAEIDPGGGNATACCFCLASGAGPHDDG